MKEILKFITRLINLLIPEYNTEEEEREILSKIVKKIKEN